jgi:hypothetical protein
MNINYKQILTYFSSIAYHHEQIRSFGFGDLTQCTNDIQTKKEPRYTRMYVVPTNVTFNENQIQYGFNIIIMDKVEDDLSNLEEVMSDTLEICTDVWTIFWQSYTQESGDFSKIIVGDWEPSIEPFTERFETILGGWTLQIKMTTPFDYNSCNLPIQSGFTFPQDESYSSYLQILEDWKGFADAHEQVNSWGFGDMEQLVNNILTKKEPLYPRMYFIPNTTTLNVSHFHITFQVIVCDIIDDDLSNQQDVFNDTLEICKDLYAKAYLSDYEVDWNANVSPWLERTETILGGWTLTMSITQKFDYNRCVLPTTSFVDNLTWEQVEELWKNVDRDWKNV